ncbi:cytochrome P450 [Thelephora terrestris]|uniref:Cytochrome P450 n=1 Tax=Thelephora terrestris TaxID=56493 RepID=A0A9P6L117_9AGAM|nr:cytochrome P450 [Thelephora terrestris]
MSSVFPPPLLLTAVSAAGIFTWLLIRRSSHLPFPPGPTPDPIIGNLRQMGSGNFGPVFEKWGKEYGPINHASVLGQHLVIINSFDTARELLDYRGSVYSSRPRMVTFSEMMGWESIISQMNSGPRWRKHRRIIQEKFGPRHLSDYAEMQKGVTYDFLAGLGKAPKKLEDHIKSPLRLPRLSSSLKSAAAMILGVTYGYAIQSIDDPFIHLADEAAVESLRYGTPGATLCDVLPMLKYWPTWMPFSFYQRHAAYTKTLVEKLFSWPLDWVQQRIVPSSPLRAHFLQDSFVPQADKTANQSLAHGLLTAVQEGRKVLGETLDYEDVKHICGALYGGGSDTSTSVLQSFFLAMTIYPDIYKKARGSIDTVVGTDRLVDISDRDALPYITCVLKEVLRWGVPTPLGVPHRLTQDDLYAGYFLPKNSTVIYNVWGLTRNEDVYPNPEVFDPDRFMNPSKPEVLQHVDSVWGFGRRVCPGKIFAESNLWLVIANTIAVMDVRKATDENGNSITPAAEFDTGAIRHAKPFNCSVTYRSERARQLVADAVAALA